jgi:hypothetical protein
MRALGWCPTHTNEEAWVVSHEPGPLDRMPARRRQELALVVSVLALVGVLAGVVLILRRVRRSSGSDLDV